MKLENVSDVYPLSPMQRGMLFHTISEPDSGVYVDQVAVTFEGQLDEQKLATTIQSVASRHTSMKTIFIWEGVDKPLQIVRESVTFPISNFDWQEQTSNEQRQSLLELIETNRWQGFDLAEAPLLRFSLIQTGSQSSIMLLTFHHLILDGWSVHVFLNELLSVYQNESGNLATPFEFKNFIAHLQNLDASSATAFWKRELSGFDEANQIGHTSAGENDPTYDQTSFLLGKEEHSALQEFARGCQVSLNTVIQAAWSLTISRFSGGSDDIVFGATVSGRPHELSGIDSAIGMFINTIPVRVKIDPKQPLKQWLAQLQSRQIESQEFSSSSLVDVQKLASLSPGSDLFESIVVFQNYPATQKKVAELRIANVEHFERSNYPLALIVVPTDKLELLAVHANKRFPAPFANRILEHVAWLLSQFVRQSNAPLESFQGLSPDHKASIAKIGCDESCRLELKEIRVDDVIAGKGINEPDAVAAVFGEQRLTYGKLNQRAQQIADQLRNSGVQSGSVVAVCVDRSFEMLIGILAALKADAAYLPLDISYPESYLQYVLNDADVKVVLTKSHLADMVPTGNFETQFLDTLSDQNATSPAPQSSRTAQTNHAAYLIYTSGSSGNPKGVVVSHANLAYSTAARTAYYGAQSNHFLLLSSFAFDSSIAGMFGTLVNGGTLVLPEPDEEKDVETLANIIDTNNVSQLLCLPSLYRLIVGGNEPEKLQSLKAAIVAGEAIGNTAAIHFERLPNTQLFNEYGPTEATVWASVHEVQRRDIGNTVPIGMAIPGTTIFLIGKDGLPVGQGSVGEICIAGPGIAMGYWNLPELTQKKFVALDMPNGQPIRSYRTGDAGYFRDDGALIFTGRIDRQVKVRGHRIEPATIERHIKKLANVSDAYVAVSKSTTSGRLIAYIQGRANEDQISTTLVNELPAFMVPSQFIFVDDFPRLANGKIDAASLPEPKSSPAPNEITPPRTDTETQLVKIWQEVLGIATIGVNQNYFTLGGDSILSIQIISRARRSGISLQPKHIAQYPTISELAYVADAANCETANDAVERDTETELSPILHWFFEMGMPEPNHWNQSMLFQIPQDCDLDRLTSAIKRTANAHPALFSRFIINDGERQRLESHSADSIAIEYQLTDFSDEQAFHQLCLRWQQSLDLEAGLLFRIVVLKDSGAGAATRILGVAHHLVIDTVSWQIIIDEIEHCYEDTQFEPPLEPCSLGQYVHQLKTAAVNAEPTVKQYWNDVAHSVSQVRLPLEPTNEPVTERVTTLIRRTLDVDSTNALRGEANEAFNTKPHQLLLAALGLTITDWTKHSVFAVNLESHGREGEWLNDLDTVRTVGWMSAVFPAVLEIANDITDTVKRVKDQLNQHWHRGIEFGAIKHLDGDTLETIDNSTPQILFNYLGVQQTKPSGHLRPIPVKPQSCRSDKNLRQHPIEINACIRNENLEIDFSYCRQQLSSDIAAKLVDDYIQRLRDVISTCRKSESAFTTSDFTEADLSQAELDDFLDSLE